MRIVVVGNFGLYRKATMASRALPIARELARAGHSLTVVMPHEASPSALVPSDDNVRLISVRPPVRRSSVVGYLWHGLRIVWAVRWLRPDAVYLFKPIGFAGLTLFVFWALRQARLTGAVIALDTDDWEGKGGWADRDPHPAWERWVIAGQERWSLRHADVVTVASRALEQLAAESGARAIYAPNAASPASPGWAAAEGRPGQQPAGLPGAPTILAYTRFVEFCPGRLVDLLAATRARVPTARLVVVGQGLRGEEREFARLARERGLGDAARVVGWVAPDRLPAYFAAADVAVYLLDDNLLNRTKCPMKLVDLLLAGVPVVADDVGQAREYIRDGESGLLVTPGDVGAMAAQVARLLGNDSLRRRLGSAARQNVLTSWTWAKQVASIDLALASARKSAGS
ncbi:MAG: glycosyltransferase family 4 protein [Chloroflexota bacterium]